MTEIHDHGAPRKPRKRRALTKVDASRNPEIGQAVDCGGQRFTCMGISRHTRRDGALTKLAIWIGECSECGDEFLFAASVRGFRTPNRRCERHRKPGVRSRFARRAS